MKQYQRQARPRPANIEVQAEAIHGKVAARPGSPEPGISVLPQPGDWYAILLGHEVRSRGLVCYFTRFMVASNPNRLASLAHRPGPHHGIQVVLREAPEARVQDVS